MKNPTVVLLIFFRLASLCQAQEAAPAQSLDNGFVETTWRFTDKGVLSGRLVQKASKEALELEGDLFQVVLADGTVLKSSDMTMDGPPHVETLAARPDAARLADHEAGKQMVAELSSVDKNLHATWRAILHDNSNYLREQVALTAGTHPVPLKEIVLFDLPVANARSTGHVVGSPLVTPTMFFAVEHPLSLNRSKDGHIRGVLPHGADLAPGEMFEGSQVIGFVREGQLRRDFLAYLERERAHPYRAFLNYNTWYDLGFHNRYDEAALLTTIQTFGDELVSKRQVKLDSFMLDDGWDDLHTIWRPHQGFPNGFSAAAKAAAKEGGALGFWLSPWGGYGDTKMARLAVAAKEGFDVVSGSFSMADPKYYERFRLLCVGVIQDCGANQFKFDGIGSDTLPTEDKPLAGGSSAFRDFEAMLRLDRDLRALKPNVFINQTTGTWPSPFWLFPADSIWRGGEDHDFAGLGSKRQQWITYRDTTTYQRVVQQGELYPLNSLMLHGIIYARHAKNLDTDSGGDFPAEVRSFFGSGTQMQELYITPELLTPRDWDTLAEAARWSRANEDVLRDTHWIGGDPSKGQIYGWASWSPRKGILTLRNPSDKPATISIDAGSIFEPRLRRPAQLRTR